MALHQQSSLLSVKSIIGLFFALLLHLTFFKHGALASPVPNELEERYVGTISPDEGSTAYPDDGAITAAYIPSTQPTVFYSNIGAPDKAQNFAASISGRLLSDCFPEKYTKYNKRGKKGFQNFIDRASGILADKASGQVYFVGRWDLKVDACRVWARVEYDSLKANTAVTKITLVNADDFTQTMDYPGPSTSKVKRDRDYCFDWNGNGEDPIH